LRSVARIASWLGRGDWEVLLELLELAVFVCVVEETLRVAVWELVFEMLVELLD